MTNVNALILVVLLLPVGCALSAQTANITPEDPHIQNGTYDIIIKDGNIIDGTGRPRFLGNIGIKSGLLYLLESGVETASLERIDATGLVVAPGFIDVHSHTPRSIAEETKRLNEACIRQGVTTVVGGPDGQLAPSAIIRMKKSYRQNGIGTNVAFYVGHNGIRTEVMGYDQQREPVDVELDMMKRLVREGMELGAVGLSTGLMYEPGMHSTTDEVVALASQVAPYKGIYDSHVRNPVLAWLESHREALEIGHRAGIPVKFAHLKEVGLHNTGLTEELISMVEQARREGVEVVSDQYPYDAAGMRITLFKILIVSDDPVQNAALHGDFFFDLEAFLNEEENRRLAQQWSENGIDGGFSWIKAVGYTSFRIVSSSDYPELVGKYISELAEERNVHPFDLICDLLIGAKEPVQIKGGIKEKTVQKIMRQPWNMIASDGVYVTERSRAVGHPRSTGTFPRVLGHYVREKRLFSLEEGIQKMTLFPADFIGLYSRGRLKNGFPADIAIFDPYTIADHSTYDEPNKYAKGVLHVLVNGTFVLRDGKMTGKAPGRALARER
ncbi:MAG: amidohydrolase family protein [Candidatus Latescibacteria bacterium]|nr:amidohydrolase family protein [Candidatus Latescibacterota bacterium]